MELATGSAADEIKRLQRCINELVSVLALPAVWSGREPRQVIRTLLDTIVSMLDLDIGFVRLNHSSFLRTDAAEVRADQTYSPSEADQLRSVLEAWLYKKSGLSAQGKVTFGDAELSVAAVRFELQGEAGWLVAGAQRQGFPQDTESLLLNVAANQAVIGLQEAVRLAHETRRAQELDDRVALRTEELAQTNQVLRHEIAERNSVEQRLRDSESALRAALETITHSEKKLRQVLDTIPVIAWCNLPDGPNEYLNRTWREYTGLSPEESHGWAWCDAMHPDDLPKLMKKWSEIMKTGQPDQIEGRFRSKDGVYRWFLIRAEPFLDENGNIFRWYGTSTDIEELKQTQKALQESESKLGAIINTIPAMVWSTRPDGYADFFNANYLAYMGLSHEDVEGWGWTRAVHPDDMKGLAEVWEAIRTAGTSGETEARLRRFDGEYRWFLMRTEVMRDASGQIVKYYGLNTDIEDRKRADAALAASERELRSTIDAIPTTAWSTRPDGYCEFLNERWLSYAGMTAEQAQGWGWSAVVHPEDLPRVVEHWQYCLRTATPVEVEGRMRRVDGEYRWFLFRANPFRDASGTIVKWFGTNIDIDDRKRAEEALRASETNLRQQIDSIPGLACTMSATGEVEQFNRPLLDYFGKSPEELKRWGTIDAVHPDDLPMVLAAFEKAVRTGTPYDVEHRCRRYDGAYLWFQVRALPVRDGDGKVTGWYVLLTDIEDRKRVEEQLLRSEEFLREGQRLARLGNFSWLVDANEIKWSEPLYEIFGFNPGEVITLDKIGERVHPGDRHLLYEMVEKANRGVSDFEYQHRIVTPDASIKHLHLIAHAVRDRNGRIEYLGAVQDVTQRNLAEAALAQTRNELANVSRATSLGVLTASIAHEVNQPIAGVVTNASTCLRMLASDPPNLDGARETARRAIRDGNRASEVIARLRTLFTRRDTRIEPLSLNEITREVVALSLSELQTAQVVLRLELAEHLPLIRGDRVQLQQVILNLLRNAADAMSNVVDRPRELMIRTELDSVDHIRLSVVDAGTGLEKDAADRLFQPFYTTKEEGMGIGLSISQSIIEAHEGRLWAASNSEFGSTFCFTLPCDTNTKV